MICETQNKNNIIMVSVTQQNFVDKTISVCQVGPSIASYLYRCLLTATAQQTNNQNQHVFNWMDQQINLNP